VSAGFKLHGPRVNSRASIVPDNHNKFAIAVTRARVDTPSFLFLVPPVVICAHHLSRAPFPRLQNLKPCQRRKAHQNPVVTINSNHSIYAQSVRPSNEISMSYLAYIDI
jgi:hypothetical protein